MATHVHDAIAVLEMEDLSDVVLCGHSYGGLVVSQVSSEAADRVAATLYLDALVADVSESLFDLVGDEFAAMLRRDLHDGWAVPCPFRYLPGVDMPAGVAEWYDSRSRPQPVRTFTDAVDVVPDSGRCGYVAYVDRDGNQEAFLHRSAERARSRGWWMRTLTGIHDAYITVPAEVASVIEEFAAAG